MDMSLSWLSKLRSFTLRQDLELDPLLGLLRGMPLLETLEITRFSASGVGLIHQESPVSLPKLSSLRLEDWEPTDTVTFLESISTSPGCCLSMSNQPRDMFASHQQDSTRAHGVFMRYMQDYFEHHRVTNLSLSYNHSYLEIRENTLISKGHPFNFSVWITNSPDNSSFLRLLLTSPFFAYVRQLDLSNSERSIPYAPSAFSSVETLDLRLTGLESLLKYLEGHDLLVRLRTLILHGRELRPEYGRWLHGVLEKRRQISRPISVLDLRNIDGMTCNLDALDDLVGLWILFPYSSSRSEESYVCGTGRPELLRFADPKHYTLYQPSYISRRLPGDKTTRTYGWSGQT
ncbi:hypothetical protein D9613_006215 [Agrocybe pediades]|uniref:Uncharacterized protein n=1 Tax=Agrocybe pediades TaxID=84607 RepID=A0A8H4QVG3_9AGAR|nr:hypothetical protein D9613_006215 [Agrocybe pediades]